MIVCNGDVLDFPGLSRYEQVPDFQKTTLRDELNLGWSFFSDLRKEHPRARIVFIEGNHEFRLKSYAIKRAPEVFNYINLQEDLELNKLGVDWIGTKEGAAKWTDTYIVIDDIHIGHFDRVNQGAGQTVRQLMIKKTGSFVQSHIHRAAIIYFTNIDGETTWGMEVPCLCKPPFYASITDWQKGLGFIDKTVDGWRPRLLIF